MPDHFHDLIVQLDRRELDNPRMSLSKSDMTGEALRSTSWPYAAGDAAVAADEAGLG